MIGAPVDGRRLREISLEKGFTLSELMIAAAILLIAILGLFTAIINCIFLNESNNHLVIAANDAQYVLEQIKGLAYDDIDNFATSYDSSYFTHLNNESVNITSITVVDGVREITANVNWTERQRNRNFNLSTRVARVELD